MRLAGKNVLITGAGGQLGKCFVKAFASEGANIWLIDSSANSLLKAKELVPKKRLLGASALDITDPQSVQDFFLKTQEKFSLDILVNNAGIGVFTSFWERSYEEFMQVLSVNVGGTFLCTREALRIMKERGTGSIINIGSIYGVISSDPRIYVNSNRMNSEVYSASKAAVIHMTKYFATHAASMGVRVNCVSPGGVYRNHGEEFVKHYSQRTPLGRMANETEICGAVVFLATPESEYITGQNIIVDGGMSSW